MLPISTARHQFLVYRDDLNHEAISGNKLHKLTPNIENAVRWNKDTVLSFGGPYSNHLHALAYACHKSGLKSIGVVRGELEESLTPTLRDCQRWGMRLVGCSRQNFRLLRDLVENHGADQALDQVTRTIDTLPAIKDSHTLLIPEGGSNNNAIDGLKGAYQPLFNQPDFKDITHAVCATGTGATVAGLRLAAPPTVKVIGVQAVAEGNATRQRIQGWFDQALTGLDILEGHLGGFGKRPQKLTAFIDCFEDEWNIPLDPIYNGKVFLKLNALIKEGYFKPSDRVLVIHTGGLQGKRGG